MNPYQLLGARVQDVAISPSVRNEGDHMRIRFDRGCLGVTCDLASGDLEGGQVLDWEWSPRSMWLATGSGHIEARGIIELHWRSYLTGFPVGHPFRGVTRVDEDGYLWEEGEVLAQLTKQGLLEMYRMYSLGEYTFKRPGT